MHKGKGGLALLIGMGKPGRGAPPKMEDEEHEATPPKPSSSSSSSITPDMVGFRTAEQVCGNCTHMSDDNCDLLNISVASGDSCSAYSEREGGAEPPEYGEKGEAVEEMPA